MSRPKNVMEIFQLLDKSNCRECGEKTCLAFASAVFMGNKKLGECPKLDRETRSRFSENSEDHKTAEQEPDEYLKILKGEIAGIDLGAAAKRVGGRFSGCSLSERMMTGGGWPA